MPHRLGVALVLALAFAGCGGDSEPGASAGEDAPATASATSTPTPEPVTKAELIVEGDKLCKAGTEKTDAAYERFSKAFDAGAPAVTAGDTAGAKKLYARAAGHLEDVVRARRETTAALGELEAPPEGGPTAYLAAREKVDEEADRVIKSIREYSRSLAGPVARRIDRQLQPLLRGSKNTRAQTKAAKAYGFEVCSQPKE